SQPTRCRAETRKTGAGRAAQNPRGAANCEALDAQRTRGEPWALPPSCAAWHSRSSGAPLEFVKAETPFHLRQRQGWFAKQTGRFREWPLAAVWFVTPSLGWVTSPRRPCCL